MKTLISISLLFYFGYSLNAQNFTAIQIDIPHGYFGSIDTADINNDNLIDFLFTGGNGSSGPENLKSMIFENNGNGGFNTKPLKIPGTDGGTIRSVDYNNDGMDDIFIMGTNPPNKFAKLFNNYGDSIAEIFDFHSGLSGGDAQWADLNNDGFKDLIILGQNATYENFSKLFRNNGDSTFTEINSDLIDVYGASIDLKDFDNDSLIDILIVGGSPKSYLNLYKNNGNFSFTNVFIGLSGINGAGAFYNFNNDTCMDIIYAGFSEFPKMKTEIGLNIENSAFTPQTLNLKPLSYPAFAFADFNKDSIVDIVMTGRDQKTLRSFLIVYYNYIDSISYAYIDSTTGIYNGEIRICDFDGDDNLDIISTGGNNTLVLKNNGTFPTSTKKFNAKTNDILMYPNPVIDQLTISFADQITLLSIEIIDIYGKLISEIPLGKNSEYNNQITIPINLNRGVYFIRCKTINENFLKKIIVSVR